VNNKIVRIPPIVRPKITNPPIDLRFFTLLILFSLIPPEIDKEFLPYWNLSFLFP